MRSDFTCLMLFLLSAVLIEGSRASASEFDGVVQAIADGAIGISRDSGQKMTREFLQSCRQDESPIQVQLRCEDLVSTWHVSRLSSTGKRQLFAISVDGASLEERWVLERIEDIFRDVTGEVWPKLSLHTISERTIEATGDAKYTAAFLAMVAHSPYRIEHPSSENHPIIVRSGVPDDTFGTKIGELRWNGTSLELH